MRTRTFLVSSAAILALTLTGCSDEDTEAAASSSSPPPPIIADSGFIADATDVELPSESNPAEGTNSTITTPSGQIDVEELADVNAIPKALTEGDASANAPEGGEDEWALPAEGEVFRVVRVRASFEEAGAGAEPTEDPGSEDEPVMGFEADKQPLGNLDMPEGEATYVVSIPQYGEAFLTVTEAGKTQKVNLADGERDENTGAAGYYREDVDPGDPIKLPGVKATGTIGLSGEMKKKATLAPVLALNEVAFSGWTPEDGWADDGKAWLTLNGTADLAVSGDKVLRGKATLGVGLSIDGKDVGSVPVKLKESGGTRETQAEFSKTIEVPADAKKLTVKVSGDVAVSAAGGVELTSENKASAGVAEGTVSLGE